MGRRNHGNGEVLRVDEHGGTVAARAFGPFDVEEVDEEDPAAEGRLDFGAVRVPLPARGSVSVEPTGNGRMQAVHVMVPEGRLSVSALAAPRSSPLWPELVKEIEASLRDGGARVRSFTGEWGRELHARSQGATSVFIGVNGARWMLYGVATGPDQDTGALDVELRRMLKGTVVVRGSSPYPPRTVLPLTVPEDVVAEQTAVEQAKAEQVAAGLTRAAPGVDPPTDRFPVLWATPDDEPTGPLTVVDRQEPGGRRGRHARREAADVAAWPVQDHKDKPALAFLMDDPMSLFSPVPGAGRHRRVD